MKQRILVAILLAGTISTGSGALAAPKVHPFMPPPRLAPAGQAEAQAADPSACTPRGSMTRKGSVVTVGLELVRGTFKINNPDTGGDDQLELRSYGGCPSGPAIEARPGDTLSIGLGNRLSAADPSCLPDPPPGLGVPIGVGCFNTTNLHTHGLHVSPAGNSDNVLLDIDPETFFPYEINIPEDHPAGTFWYHAHRHGSTAVHVASGAAGALIIRGDRAYTPPTKDNPNPSADIDTILHRKDGTPFPEKLFLFQQIAYACFKNPPNKPAGNWQQLYTKAGLWTVDISNNHPNDPTNTAPWVCPKPTAKAPVSPGVVENFALQLDSATIWDTNGRFTSINGVIQPTIEIPAGEIQRWRFVHAGIHDTINAQLVRAAPNASGRKIGASALTGNRNEQEAEVLKACTASGATLIPQYEIATDGLTRPSVREIRMEGQVQESNYLQPGYRSDVLVVFPSDGDYCLLDQAAPAGSQINPSAGTGGGQGPTNTQLLAYVRVRGGIAVPIDQLGNYIEQTLFDANAQLPAPVRAGLLQGDLRPWAPFLSSPPPTGLQQAYFAITGTPLQTLFQVNGQSYDPDVINITRQVNTTDDWLLAAGGEPHIFHIHVNPFEIVDVQWTGGPGDPVSIYDKDGNCRTDLVAKDSQGLAGQYCGMKGTFRDTLFVENGYQIRVRTTYLRYIGEYVLHCHILDHEDGGMMLNIAIVPDLQGSARGGHGPAGASHHR